MNKNKVITVGLSLALSLGAVACTKKTEPPKTDTNTPTQQNSTTKNDYSKYYATGYNNYLVGLGEYSMYGTPGDINTIYKDKEYPGNEKYLSDVKAAYKDSRDKIKSFVDSLKKDAKTEDTELKKMNDELIAEGEKLIKDIDAKLARLDEIPKDATSKTKEEFSKMVTDATTIKDQAENNFNKMIRDMNEMFGINNHNNKNNK